MRILSAAGWAGVSLCVASCLSKPSYSDGALRCSSDDDCPSGYTCEDDGLCVRTSGDGGVIESDSGPATFEAAGLRVEVKAGNDGVIQPDMLATLVPSWTAGVVGTVAATLTTSDTAVGAGPTASYTFEEAGVATESDDPHYELQWLGMPRPEVHWDAIFTETLGGEAGTGDRAGTMAWTVHIGGGIGGVEPGVPHLYAIEALQHNRVVKGSAMVPGNTANRLAAAVWFARALLAGEEPPLAAEHGDKSYDCGAAMGGSNFTDIPAADNTTCRATNYVYIRGITSGCTSGNFCPGEGVTRGQAALWLAAALGAGELAGCTEKPFSDVDITDLSCPAVTYLQDAELEIRALGLPSCGATSCTEQPCFCGGDDILMGELASFVAGGFGLTVY